MVYYPGCRLLAVYVMATGSVAAPLHSGSNIFVSSRLTEGQGEKPTYSGALLSTSARGRPSAMKSFPTSCASLTFTEDKPVRK